MPATSMFAVAQQSASYNNFHVQPMNAHSSQKLCEYCSHAPVVGIEATYLPLNMLMSVATRCSTRFWRLRANSVQAWGRQRSHLTRCSIHGGPQLVCIHFASATFVCDKGKWMYRIGIMGDEVLEYRAESGSKQDMNTLKDSLIYITIAQFNGVCVSKESILVNCSATVLPNGFVTLARSIHQ